MPFQFHHMEIPEVILIEPRTFQDARGFFMEVYKRSDFAAHDIPDQFVQVNFSRSVRGTLRGLHYQRPPQAQGKLVMALRGEVVDVVVDIRQGSPTYGQWVSAILSGENLRMLYVPAGFAHGFCVLSEDADFVYQVTAEYAPHLEAGIVWDDPTVNVEWPIADPLLSEKDAALPLFPSIAADFVYTPCPKEN